MSDSTMTAIAIHKKLQNVANIVNAAPGPKVEKSVLVEALSNPDVCTFNTDSGKWQFYNATTGQWGGEC